MALRAFAMRLGSKRAGTFCRGLQSRAFSTDGRILSEEERAAENLYIKKMEKERLEKARQKAKQGEAEVGGSSAEPGSSSMFEPSKESSKKFTIVAGVAAVLGIGWWLSSSGSKKHEEK